MLSDSSKRTFKITSEEPQKNIEKKKKKKSSNELSFDLE